MPAIGNAIFLLFLNTGMGLAAAGWLTAFVGKVLFAFGLSALSRALQKKPKFEQPGLTTEATQTGGTDPQAFIVGRYATGGQLVAPPMTHGSAGGTPNAYLTYVIAVSDIPGVTLSKVFIDGNVTTNGATVHPDYGTPLVIKGVADKCWLKFHNGTQTAADPMLLAKYNAHPQRPWTSDMVGTGTAYAILTFRFDRELFKGFPSMRFELGSIPLYDPRKDPTMGGAGTQSWSNPATWTQTGNPAVIIYNILRGVSLPGGDVWGGGWGAGDLPIAVWATAMNACDRPVTLAAGGSEPAYRAGFEIAVDREPAEIIEELLKTCAGRITDVGGLMKIVVGAPGVAVKGITDDDIIVTDEQSHAIFPSLAQTHNGVHATFPDPSALWESRDAPPRYDAVAEAADGRRLVATVALPACPWPIQVQRLMKGWINEERRFRRHQLVLPPDAAILEPLDTISWTSARNGYSAKMFEVVEIAHDPVSLLQAMSLREIDPTDYDWNETLELPWVAPVTGSNLPSPQVVPLFDALGIALDDATGTPRRPAIILTWNGANQDDVSALEYELRRQGGTQVMSGATLSVAAGRHVISAGILPDTIYEVRGRFIAPRPVLWTGWVQAITPPAYVSPLDFEGGLDQLFADADMAPPRVVTALPVGNPNGWDLIFLTTDAKLYRWNMGTSTWTTNIDGSDLGDGAVTNDHIVAGSVDADRLVAGTITTGLLAAGAVKAANMVIDESLSIDATDAGFAMGKQSVVDFSAPGLYMGRSMKGDGSTGYGFLMGSTSPGGVNQYVQATEDDGVSIVNVNYGLLAPLSAGAATYTTSQTIALGATTEAFSLELLAGAGGGGVYASAGYAAAQAGGNTVVKLYDGATYTGTSWTANGGAVGASTTGSTATAGQSSTYGSGGAAGRGSYTTGRDDNFHPAVNGGNGTGRGAGGGGGAGTGSNSNQTLGGLGGGKGSLITISNYNLKALGLTNPQLQITIGAGGAGGIKGSGTGSSGGAGSGGQVKVTKFATAIIPAGVVPLYPTISAQFLRAANATGNTIFPDLGPGMWVLTNGSTGTQLEMNIGLKPGGYGLVCWNAHCITFVTDGRPTVTQSGATAITYNYLFYRMKV